jgi:hypothetical protein
MTRPDHSVDEEPIPPALGENVATAFGLEEPPRTVGDWAESLAEVATGGAFELDLEALCTTADSAHVAEADGERHHFKCVMDAFLLPAILDTDHVAVESTSPLDGERIQFSVTRDGVSADPPGAVISFGAATDVEPPADGQFDPRVAYAQVCPYINAFPSRAAYERWDRETDGAVTIGLPVERGVELAGLLVDSDPFVTEA